MKVRKRLLVSLSILVVTALMVGVGIAEGKGESPPGYTLRVIYREEADMMDPQITWMMLSKNITYSVAEGLVGFVKDTLEVEPILAESWNISEDGKKWTFRLRKGIKFTDGAPFNAEAVAFNFDRLMDIGLGPARFFQYVDRVEVVDQYTVKFYLKAPRAAFLRSLPWFRIVSPKVVREHRTADDPWAKNWFQAHVVGTGPYLLAEWVRDQYIKIVRNEDYWRGWQRNQVSELIALSQIEPTAACLMLERGDVDIIMSIAEEKIPSLRGNPDIGIRFVPSLCVFQLQLNNAKDPLTNLLVRRAVAHSFNFEEYCKLRERDLPRANTPFLPELTGGEIPNLQKYPYDIEKAKVLLKEAGYKPGELELTMGLNEGDLVQRKTGLVLQDGLKKVGIKLNIRTIPWAQLVGLMHHEETALDIVPYYASSSDGTAVAIANLVLHSKSIGYRNFMFYQNEEVDRLTEEAEEMVNDEKRLELIRQIARIVMEDCPAVYLNMKVSPGAFRKGITYYPVKTSTTEFRVYSVRVEKRE